MCLSTLITNFLLSMLKSKKSIFSQIYFLINILVSLIEFELTLKVTELKILNVFLLRK